MSAIKHEIQTSTEVLLEKAEEFHGHLGPFLVLGLRMGLTGMKELGITKHDGSQRISLAVLSKTPYSCVVDGIQISTGCTIGNQRLQLRDSEEIKACFEDANDKRKIVLAPQPTILSMLREQLISKNLPKEEVTKLARQVAVMPEKELLLVRNE